MSPTSFCSSASRGHALGRASRLAAGLFTLCVVGQAPPAQQPPLFARQQFPTGSDPVSAELGDLDGDGALDLVAADIGSSTLSVLRNVADGRGTLAPQVEYAAGAGLTDVAVGDVDGDGALDLLAANVFPGSVSVLRNHGDGTFAPRVAYPAGFSVSALAAGDLNGDGALDVVVISTNVSVLLNQGNGTFAAPVSYRVPDGTSAVALGDLNGDGALDLAVGQASAASVSVLLNDGSGRFGVPVPNFTASSVSAVAIADLNGDGALDLAVANATAGSVSVLLNQGNATFAPQVAYATRAFPNTLVIGDVDADAALDLAVLHDNAEVVAVLRNEGGGTFAAPVEYHAGGGPSSVAIGDMGGDGALDLVVLHRQIDRASVLPNNGDGTFAPPQYAFGSPESIAIGHLDADDALDLVVTNALGYSVLLNDRHGGFVEILNPCAGCGGAWPDLADIDGDRAQDVAAVSGSGAVVLRNAGSGRLGPPMFWGNGFSNPISLAVADLNHDGAPDLALGNPGKIYGGQALVRFNLGNGSFGAEVAYGTDAEGTSVLAGDVNGDGAFDLVVGGASVMSLLLNRGDGSFLPSIPVPLSGSGNIGAIGDLNGDGAPDLVATYYFTRTVSVLLNDRTGGFAETLYTVGGLPDAVAIGDLDGDGAPDLAVTDEERDAVLVLLNRADGTFDAPTSYGTSGDPERLVIGDLDGDGAEDLAVTSSGIAVSVLFHLPAQLCQPDLGGQGPGTVAATLCGTGLAAGKSSLYRLTGATPSAVGALLVSRPNQPNVTLFPAANPGVLVSGAGLIAAVPIAANAQGALSIEVDGIATPVDLVLQSVLVDAAVLPHNLAFSNAILAAFGN